MSKSSSSFATRPRGPSRVVLIPPPDWEQTKTPAGATLWIPKGGAMATAVPDAHIKGKRHAPVMFTTDLALKMDPVR